VRRIDSSAPRGHDSFGCKDEPVMNHDTIETTHSVIAKARIAPKKRALHTVPFVELFGDRLQGVVSSKTDIKRVYVSFFEAGTGDFYCSTNNNRSCGGLRGSPCKHLDTLLDNALAQYGSERIIRHLRLDTDDSDLDRWGIRRLMNGREKKTPANEVFSRFLNYLRYVELQGHVGAVPEMNFFITG
jgi:hypothetical protein